MSAITDHLDVAQYLVRNSGPYEIREKILRYLCLLTF